MHGVLPARIEQSRQIERTLVQGTARLCSGKFGRAWKALFPIKAAEELAARTGQSVRAAAYELSGEREPSGKSLAALISLCLERD